MANERVTKLIELMAKMEREIGSRRKQLEAVTGNPRLQALQDLQADHRRRLGALVALFWAENQADRAALLDAYLSALITFKLVCDDLFVEALEEAIQPKNGTDPPGDKRPIETLYRETIEDWIVGSPLLDPTTFKNNHIVLPKIGNRISSAFTRTVPDLIDRLKDLRAAVKAAVQAEQQRISAGPKASPRLSASADHLLGLLFLLAQLELFLTWENDQTLQADVDLWYAAAFRPVRIMGGEVLGVFDEAIRTAIFATDDPLTERLVTARHFLVIDMATRYSLRRLETRVLLSFFEKQNSTGRFASQDLAIGVNKVTETLFAYVGRPDADHQENRSAISVGNVRAREAQLTGTNVRVFGLANKPVTKLTDERTKDSLAIDDPNELGQPFTIGANRRVIVAGRLAGSGKTLTLTATSIIPHSEGYRALVGFPLRFAQLDQSGRHLELQPSFRTTTAALQRAAGREEREDEEGVFSVPQTLAGQGELVTDLLRNAEVRKTFATPLKKAKDLDLQNNDTRGKVWSIFFKEMAKSGNRSAMRTIGAFVGTWFAHYTRHTYYNLRDSGKNYLDSPWPTDLTNRKLHDCGVYAVQAAFDLFRAVQGTPGVALEFRFLTFLNHLCLIVYFDDQSFLVNNATVSRPEPFRAQGTAEEKKIAAAFDWGGVAFTTVYDVSYTMFLAVLPQRSIDTNHTETDFRKGIFQLFLDSIGWGISNVEAVAADYFKAIALFDTGSKKLAALLPTLHSAKASKDDWNNATTMALDLYTLGEAMTDFKNFVFFNPDFVKHKPVPAVGFSLERDVVAAGARTLPMYEVAQLLAQGKSGQPLTAAQKTLAAKKTGSDHLVELTKKFQQDAAAAGKKP